jgi:hypothetical protein
MIPASIYNLLSSPTNSTSSTISSPKSAFLYLPLLSHSRLFFFSFSNSESLSNFTELLADAGLPPPGPGHFAARRALWTKPTASSRLDQAPPPSRVRLENLLDQPGGLESPEVWDAVLSKICKGLVGGCKLKSSLPLRVVVCLHSGIFLHC